MRRIIFLILFTIYVKGLFAFNAEFFPQKRARNASEVRIRFEKAVAPIGDPRYDFNPIELISCIKEMKKGVWEEPSLYVLKFDEPLMAGMICKVRLKDDIISTDGDRYTGPREFQFDTDVVTVDQIVPSPYQEIRNEEVFLFTFNGDVDIKKNLKNIFFVRKNTLDTIGVELIDKTGVNALIDEFYPYLKDKKDKFYGIRPKVRFADEEEVTLVFRNIESTSGISSMLEQQITYTVNKGFKIELSCEREKADRGCVPLSYIHVEFSEKVDKEYAQKIYIADSKGNKLYPDINPLNDVYTTLTFNPPFRPSETYTLYIPQDIRDIYNRRPVNIDRFPLAFRVDRMPPLAKFASKFGIVEMINGEGVLPLTIRGVRKDLVIKGLAIESGSPEAKIEKKGFFERILNFIKKIFRAIFGIGSKVNKDLEDERRYILPEVRLRGLKISELAPKEIFEFVNNMKYESYDKSVFKNHNYNYEENRLLSIPDTDETTVIGIPMKKYGLYFFEVESSILGDYIVRDEENIEKKAYIHSTALVTDMAITFKRGIYNSLIFVTRLSDGSPVSDAQIKIYDCKGNEYYSGTTNRDGILFVDKALPTDNQLPYCESDYTDYSENLLSSGLIVIAKKGEDFSLVSSKWDKGIEPYRYNIYNRYIESRYIVHTLLSRNLLRAGETLHIKGYFRKRLNKDITVADREEMPRKIRIEHTGTGKVWEYDIKWDELSNTFFKWDIPKDAHTGTYKIYYFDCPNNSRCLFESSSFTVEEFKVPLIKGELVAKEFKKGKVLIEGLFSYLMGAPANDLQVQLKYKTASDFHYTDDRFPDYVFSKGRVETGIKKENTPYDEEYDEGFIPYYPPEQRGISRWQSVNLTTDSYGRFKKELDLDLTDTETPFTLYLEAGYVDPNGYYNTISDKKTIYPSPFIIGVISKPNRKEKVVDINAVLLDTSFRPVKDEKITLKLFERTNYIHRKKVFGGYYSYEYVKEIKYVKDICNKTTDTNGKITCKIQFEREGSFIVEASAGDEKRGLAYTSDTYYIYSYYLNNWYEYYSDSDRTDLIPDKKNYRPNETAKIKVITPFERSTALITIEREGILDYFVREIDARDPFIDLPVKPEYSPNVYISVVLIRGRVKSPPPTALVDLAKPSFKMGLTKIEVDKERYRIDVKVTTNKKRYQTREKVKGSIILSGPENGNVDLTLIVVDEGLLTLLENPTYDILNNIVKDIGLNVNTATGMCQVVGKRHYGKKALPTGGGGGRIVTRELFDTLIYYNNSLKVKDKRADFEFTLNDSITSFRIIAVASTINRFGTGYANIESYKELFINSSLPYFSREGDRFDAEFVIKSVSEKEYNLTVKMNTSFYLNGEEVKKEFFEPKEVKVKPGGNQRVSFSVSVPDFADEGRFRVDILNQGKVMDSINVRQKIVESAYERVVQSVFRRFSKKFEEDCGGSSEVKVGTKIDVILMRDLKETGKALINYRGFTLACLEQKISYAVVAEDRKFFDNLMNEIKLYIDKDGLLKYYTSSTSGSPMLTAYVLDITNLSGFELPADVVEKTTDALENFVIGRIGRIERYISTTWNLEKLYALSVLSRYKKNRAKEILETMRYNLSTLPLSSLIDIANIKESPELKERILSFFIEKGSAYFIKTDPSLQYWWLMRSDDEAFAKALIYLISSNTDDTRLGKMAQGLLNRFENRGYLMNTTANAYAAVALRLFSKRYSRDIRPSTINVSYDCNHYSEKVDNDFNSQRFVFTLLNDREIKGGSIDSECTKAGQNILSISEEKNEYWMRLLVSQKSFLNEPVYKGFKIKKEYLDEAGNKKTDFKVSDVVKVRLTIEGDSIYNNIVIIDPLITGSQVEGRIKDSGEYKDFFWNYTYSDVRDGFIRTYYEFVYSEKIIFEYTMRLNTRGEFNLPPTRVELMYLPDIYGEIPNERIVVH